MSTEAMDAFLAKAMEEVKADEQEDLRIQEEALSAMLDDSSADRLPEPQRTQFRVRTRADVARLRFEAGDVAGAIEAVEASMLDAQASGVDTLINLVAQDLFLIMRFAAIEASQIGFHDRALHLLERVSGLPGLSDSQKQQLAGDRFVVIDMRDADGDPKAKQRAMLAALGRVLDAAPEATAPVAKTEVDLAPKAAPMMTTDEIRRALSKKIGRDIAQADLPEMKTVPAAETGRFDSTQIAQVVSAHKGSVSSCYNRALKSGQTKRGKLELLVTVKPTGIVSNTAIASSKFKNAPVGVCIAETVKRWRFPPFGGQPQQVSIPFVLDYF